MRRHRDAAHRIEEVKGFRVVCMTWARAGGIKRYGSATAALGVGQGVNVRHTVRRPSGSGADDSSCEGSASHMQLPCQGFY